MSNPECPQSQSELNKMQEPKAIAKSSRVHLTVTLKQSFAEKVVTILAILLILIFPLVLVMCFRVIKQYKRGIVMRLGKLRVDCPVGPGIIWIIPYTDYLLEVDLRTQTLNLPSQEIITKDSVTVKVDALVYFHVFNPLKASMNVQSYHLSTRMISIAMLRNVLGRYTLKDVLILRDVISQRTKSEIDNVTNKWGVTLERFEIKQVQLPFDLQKAMAAEAEGTRLAKAKIIEARGEIQTAENLKDASEIMVENPQIMLLRYLQTLNYIASQQSTSIFFPFPMEMPETLTPSPACKQGVSKTTSFLVRKTDVVGETRDESNTG